MLSRSPEELAATLADIGEKRRAIDRLMADHGRAITTDKGREHFSRMVPAVANFWEVGDADLKGVQEGRQAEAFAFLVDKTIPGHNVVLEEAATMVSHQRGLLEG